LGRWRRDRLAAAAGQQTTVHSKSLPWNAIRFNDHFPPGEKSKAVKVLVNPEGPHHSANRAPSSNAAKTLDSGAASSREARITV
jgi:hypothetical protein